MSIPIQAHHWLLKALFVALVASGTIACGADDTSTADNTEPAEPVTSTTPADPAEQGQLAMATAFWEAVAAGDREAARSLMDPMADPSANMFGRAATLKGQFDWYESVGLTWQLEGCTEAGTQTVECSATARNQWSEALGVEPVTGTFTVWFGNDGILDIVDKRNSFVSQWGPMVFGVFAQWVDENHPDDARVMFADVDINPEILDLYQRNTTPGQALTNPASL